MTDVVREELRRAHQVRPLAGDEEGRPLSNLPAGVYGFTYAPLGEVPLFERHAWHSFEVHKTADGEAHLLVFVTPAEAEALRSGATPLELRLYPDEWEQATELVSIETGRISADRLRPSRESGNWIGALVRPASTADAQPH